MMVVYTHTALTAAALTRGEIVTGVGDRTCAPHDHCLTGAIDSAFGSAFATKNTLDLRNQMVNAASAAGVGRLQRALKLLVAAKQTVGVAETSAGGMIAATLLANPGASAYFAGGVVVYTKAAKTKFLGIDAEKSKPTASEPHAVELAHAMREALHCDWAIGETGVAGPLPNSRGIAPGVCGLAVVGPDGLIRKKTLWPDDTLSDADAYGQPPRVPRPDAMANFEKAALELLCDAVLNDQTHPAARLGAPR